MDQEYIFGSIDEYIAAIPEPGLNKERTRELKEFVAARDGKNNSSINQMLLKKFNNHNDR